MSSPPPDRRAFLTGEAWRAAAERVGDARLDRQRETAQPPQRGPTLLLRTTAMATDFDVLLNPDGPADQVVHASAALDEVHRLEQRYSSYRDDSDLMQLNRAAPFGPVSLDDELYGLLQRGRSLHEQTAQAFDHATGALIRLWRTCRQQARLPNRLWKLPLRNTKRPPSSFIQPTTELLSRNAQSRRSLSRSAASVALRSETSRRTTV